MKYKCKHQCKLCGGLVGKYARGKQQFFPTVRVIGDLFGKQIDLIFHEWCWLELKIE